MIDGRPSGMAIFNKNHTNYHANLIRIKYELYTNKKFSIRI